MVSDYTKSGAKIEISGELDGQATDDNAPAPVNWFRKFFVAVVVLGFYVQSTVTSHTKMGPHFQV